MKNILLCMALAFSINNIQGKDSVQPQVLDIQLSSKGNDIAFNVTSLQVPFGKKIVLKFMNAAKEDSEITHNIAILTPGSTDAVLKYFESTDYNLEKVKKHKSVLAITPSLEPGQSSELTLDKNIITKEGYYPYICLIPGHADMLGMKGVMHVKKSKI